ncbi:MAG TPA: aspartyl protease family protein [Thermoanaerobaculia bacterium]|nr:aspartyl protease family protein [Thermoanaerobaculia bacterium]
MLRLRSHPFTSGRSLFADHVPGALDRTAKIFVKIGFAGLDSTVLAQLDTGAAWSVLSPDVAQQLNLPPDAGNPAVLQTWLGRRQGHLVRVPFLFLADEGEPFPTEGTFFVTPDWPEGMTFLGYSGLLDSIRFAVDPQANDFFFGPC